MTTIVDYVLAAEAACLGAVLWRRQGPLHPVTLFAALWAAILVVRIAAPIAQAEMTSTAAWVLGLGVLAVCLPAAIAGRPRSSPDQLGDRDVALPRLLALVLALGAAVLLGLYVFRSHVSSYYVGADFGQLSAEAVRAAQLAGSRGGPLTLLSSLAPLLGALGIYGALRYSRWWWAVPALALFATLQSPARISTLGLVVSCAMFYLYARDAVRQDPQAPVRGRRSRSRVVWQLLAVGAASLWYFIYTGTQRGGGAASLFATDWTWPMWLLSPVVYLVGGVAGLAATTSLPIGDPYGPDGHPVTVYLPLLLTGQDPPDTLADFTEAPFPINIYTAFGDLYFDFGVLGAVALALLLGLVTQAVFHRHAWRLEYAWVAAVLANVLLSTGLAYRLFYLDVSVLMVCGWGAFAWLRRAQRTRPGQRTGAPAKRGSVNRIVPLMR